MTTCRRLILVPFMLLALAGCAAKGPAFRPAQEVPPNKALVYIYRLGGMGSGVTYTVKTGDEEIVSLSSGGYYPYLADPGEREFWARTEAKATATEQLRAGETYYLKGGIGIGFFVGHPKLAFVSRAVGESEVKDCNLLAK